MRLGAKPRTRPLAWAPAKEPQGLPSADGGPGLRQCGRAHRVGGGAARAGARPVAAEDTPAGLAQQTGHASTVRLSAVGPDRRPRGAAPRPSADEWVPETGRPRAGTLACLGREGGRSECALREASAFSSDTVRGAGRETRAPAHPPCSRRPRRPGEPGARPPAPPPPASEAGFLAAQRGAASGPRLQRLVWGRPLSSRRTRPGRPVSGQEAERQEHSSACGPMLARQARGSLSTGPASPGQPRPRLLAATPPLGRPFAPQGVAAFSHLRSSGVQRGPSLPSFLF